VAHWCRHALVLLFPARGGVTMHLPGEIDWRVLALSAGVCLIATLLLGLVPAMQTSKIDLAGALKSDSAGVVGAVEEPGSASGLVVVQVSLSFVLLVGASLLMQSLPKNKDYQPGFFDALKCWTLPSIWWQRDTMRSVPRVSRMSCWTA